MSKNIRNFVFKKRRVFKKYRNTGEEKFLTLFNKIYSKIGSILEEFWHKIKTLCKSKSFFKLYKYIRKRSLQQSSNILINGNNVETVDNSEIVNAFNSYFKSNFRQKSHFDDRVSDENNSKLIEPIITTTDCLRECQLIDK